MFFKSRKLGLFPLVLIAQFIGESLCEGKVGATNHNRITRSIKDALPKDDMYSQSRAITDMRHKIFNLESSMKSMNTEIEKQKTSTDELKESVVNQNALIEKLNVEVESLKEVITGHSGTIADLEKIAKSDENIFAMSNQTCGGVLVGQTGSIIFTSIALRGVRRNPSTCVWTLRANNRASIKITSTHTHRYYGRPNAYILEILNNGTNSTTLDPSNLIIKATRLEPNMPQIFKGPIVYVVYVLTSYNDDYSTDTIDMNLHFEGLGTLVEKTTYFSHENLLDNSGNYSDTQIDNWINSPTTDSSGNVTYSLDYTSIVISNFSTKVHLQAMFENGRCGNRDTSFLVITNLMESKPDFVDCCQESCDGKKSLINYENPFLILIFKKHQVPLKFNLNWEAEKPYPSSSTIQSSYSAYGHKCGEIFGGTSGSIVYKPHVSYRNGERCIWAIVPQPRPRASITINVGANGVESSYDHLYMLELTDVNGTLLAESPKITRLGRYGTYVANSREVYVVFYSDNSVTGYGFSLSWRASGEAIKTGGDVTTRFTILKNETGLATSLQERPSLTNSVYQVFLLTPIVPYSYVYGMELHVGQTHPTPRGCLHEDINIYTAVDGILAKPNMDEICSEQTEEGKIAIENADGMAIIVVNDRSPDNHVAMNFSWREEFGKDGSNNSYLTVDNNECGGVIKGSKGVLKYHIGQDYMNNERCVWLLQTPNHTSITLKLLKDGFETCCDHILVTTVDPRNGTLRNDTTIINRANRTQTFEDSVLVVVFRSDTSTRGRGFALQFVGNGEADPIREYHYQLRHHNEPYGGITYPSSEWEETVPGTKNIFLIASSIKVSLDEDPLSMPTNVSWTSGVFRKVDHASCGYESITFYTTPDSTGWLNRERYPHENDTASCDDEVRVPEKADICNTVFSTFLAIYRHTTAEDEEEGESETKMGFTYQKSAGCGGVLIGDSGQISYKEDGKYSNSEKCIWLIHAPEAKRIRFYLTRSGFEVCCDLIFISSVNKEGALVLSGLLQQTNRSATVDGPVAVVIFTTDGSVTGDGFRLDYFTDADARVNASDPFPFTYHLEHRSQPKENAFVLRAEPNQVIVSAFSPESYGQARESATARTQIKVESMRAQVDQECKSDELTFYDVYGSERGLVKSKSFSATDILKGDALTEVRDQMSNGNCTALENQVYNNCENILDCGDAPENKLFNTNTTSFVAVYKSVNASGDLSYRGVVMVSTPLSLLTSSRTYNHFAEYGSGETLRGSGDGDDSND